MKVGTRVRIANLQPDEWAYKSIECLDGRVGTINEVKCLDRYLVAFDTPVKSWWEHGSAVHAFHFDGRELEEI